MLLSIFCWFIVFFLGLFVSGFVDSQLKKKALQNKKKIAEIISFAILLIFAFSPLYIEYPGTDNSIVAVITDLGKIQYKKLGVIEPLVKGKIIRISMPEVENEYPVKEKLFNTLPEISFPSTKVSFKITDHEKFIKHANWMIHASFDNWILRKHIDNLVYEIQKEEIRSFLSKNRLEHINIISEEKKYKEKAKPIEKKILEFLQQEMDKIESGILFTKVVL